MFLAYPSPTKTPAPLAGVRVVAVEQAVAAPLCTRHLADLGADVIKIERPGGDFARRYDSVVAGASAYFVWLNYGKRSVVLDLGIPDDRDLLAGLLAGADVFVHNLGPGAIDRLGFDWASVHERWPRLITCAISGYGITGPDRDRKAFDLLMQGESGVMAVTGSEDAPAKVGISIADISAGMYALAAVLAALQLRGPAGPGTFIDISMLECLAEWMTVPLMVQEHTGRAPARTGMRHSSIVPYGPYRVAGGTWVNIAVQNEGQWRRLCERVLGRPDLLDDPRFVTNESRARYRDGLEEIIEVMLGALSRERVLRLLEEADVPHGSVNDPSDLLAHPQLAARTRWRAIQTEGGSVRAPAHPLNIVGLDRPGAKLPGLDEHGEEVRRGKAWKVERR